MHTLSDFDFLLPKELIAQYPVNPRDSSRLLLIKPLNNKITLEDKYFSNIVELLSAEDVIILNNTKVIPSYLSGKVLNTNKEVSINLVRMLNDHTWFSLIKPSKRIFNDAIIEFSKDLQGKIIRKDNDNLWLIEFNKNENELKVILENIGSMPLPPYIKRSANEEDKTSYQTTYAQNPGSVAAPTAGLHFSKEIINKIHDKGVKIAYVTLHVGAGTFMPIRSENLNGHIMHEEIFEVSSNTCEVIKKAKSNGGRVICVGTTVVRALESIALLNNGVLKEYIGSTNIFIKPGYEFKITDALLTNFHLPKSTLFILVCAFAGRLNMIEAYQHAIRKKYRFFSYGDACFIEKNSQ